MHVGDMPFQCDMVDTLLSGGGLLCVDGVSQQVFKVEGKFSCNEIVLISASRSVKHLPHHTKRKQRK